MRWLQLLLLLAGCHSAPTRVSATQWPEADALFHSDPRWLGADAAYSVSLGPGRTLWLFGDTFVATTAANRRSESKLVRNTVAVQTGSDPTTASIAFSWADGPGSFFPEQGDHWLWPLHGARIGDHLVLFFSFIRATPGEGLGFAGDGWRAVEIDNPDADPRDWHQQVLTPTNPPAGISVGTSIVVSGDFVFAVSAADANDHSGYLARWKSADLAAGKIDAIEWWNGTGYAPGATPVKALDTAGPECSVHFDGASNRFVHVRSDGFGASTIVVSFADRLEGPWSVPSAVFDPPEDKRNKPFVYAAKAHPELSGGALAVTYVSNTFDDFSTLVNDTSIYFPRFVKISLTP